MFPEMLYKCRCLWLLLDANNLRTQEDLAKERETINYYTVHLFSALNVFFLWTADQRLMAELFYATEQCNSKNKKGFGWMRTSVRKVKFARLRRAFQFMVLHDANMGRRRAKVTHDTNAQPFFFIKKSRKTKISEIASELLFCVLSETYLWISILLIEFSAGPFSIVLEVWE